MRNADDAAVTLPVSIRAGVAADAAALANLAALTFAQAFAKDNRPEDLQAHLQTSYGEPQQRRELQDPAILTLLAESGGALIGYAQIGRATPPDCVRESGAAELMRFYVDAAAHGRGVAQRLMDGCFQAARATGAMHLWLGVWERNPRAIAFYKKSGFRDVGSKVFVVGSDAQTDRVMLAALSVRPSGRLPEPAAQGG